jgi:hypothetical protein
LTAPVRWSMANISCRTSPPNLATTYSTPLAAIGVLVMPSGSMLPHGRSDCGDGLPRLRFHIWRYALSKA